MPDEVELKLALKPQDAATLAKAGLGEPRTARQWSVYFDTANRDLSKAGLSLRIRRSGGKRIQTVKARGTGSVGLFARSEWERSVADDNPILDDTTIPTLLGGSVAALAPAFAVDIERRSWVINEGDTIIDLVLDRGDVVAGDRRSAICEIELELKHGDPAALYALAHRLDAAAPVRVGVLTKAERGYALLDAAVTAFKAGRIELRRDMTTAQALQHIVLDCLRQFRLNEDLFLAGHAPEALHQARVALRRLRTALSIFKALLDDGKVAGLRSELRWLARELGEARSIDALLERAPPDALRDRLEMARQTAYCRVDEALASRRTRGLMLNLAEWVGGGWQAPADLMDQSVRDFATATLDHLRRSVRKDGRDLAEADDPARHEVRKDAKKLRYAAEFFTALFDRKRERRRYKQFVAALEGLQDELGVLNDLVTAPDVLNMLDIGDAPGAVASLFPATRKKLLASAEDAHDRLARARRFWR